MGDTFWISRHFYVPSSDEEEKTRFGFKILLKLIRALGLWMDQQVSVTLSFLACEVGDTCLTGDAASVKMNCK